MPDEAAPNTQARGYAIALIGTVVWSVTGVLIRALTERSLPPLVLAFWRDALVTVSLALALAVLRPALLRVPRRHLRFLVLYSLVLTVFNAMWTFSVALNGAAVSTVLIYSSPAVTAVLGWWLWRESLGVPKIVAVVLSLGGSVLVSGAYSAELWALNPLGIVIGLVSGLMFVAYSLMGKSAAQRGVNPWTVLLYTFGLAAVNLLVITQIPVWRSVPGLGGAAAGDLLYLRGDTTGWLLLVALAIGPTIGGYGLYNVSLSLLPASVANLIVSLEPSMTALLAYLFLGEQLTGPQLAGSVMIVSGVLLLRVSSLRRRAAAAPVPQI